MPEDRPENRVLFVTGASTGIGAATARAAAAKGWKVALAARSADRLAALVEEIGDDRALALTCNVARQEDVVQAVEAAAEFGPIHAAFANAGVGVTVAGAETGDPDNWRQMLDINVWGLLLTVKATLPHLRATKGHMLLTGSQAGRTHMPGSVYGATKWFVHGFGQNLALEMKEWGGRCTVIAPGMVDTPFFDEPKPGALTSEQVAEAVVYALDQPHGVTIREVFLTPTDR
jgi:NADP-dependent 3-hydroxy acid dehydrogenase YdfG